jgi:hypothetical protein
MGMCLSIGPDRGRCNLVQIQAWWFHTSFSSSPYRENPGDLVLSYTEWYEGNLLAET